MRRARGRGRRFAFAAFLFPLSAGAASISACEGLRSAALDDAGAIGSSGAAADGTIGTREASANSGSSGGSSSGGGEIEDAGADADSPVDAGADVERSNGPYCAVESMSCTCVSVFVASEAPGCAATDFPNGSCCADPGWPSASGSVCTCGTWACRVNASGSCTCGALEGGTPACDDAFCCAHPNVGTCTCASTAAVACPSHFVPANNIPVASCSHAIQPCPRGGKRVSTCNL